MHRVTRGELEAVSKRQKLHLTVSQLTDLVNWLSGSPKFTEPIPRLAVSTWSTPRRLAVEAWCDAQMALAKITPRERPMNGRYPGEQLPPELAGFRAFRCQVWGRWPRAWEKLGRSA